MATDKKKKRPNPTQGPTGQAGNYQAPIDTVGMDPEMIRTLKANKPKKRRSLFGMLRGAGKQGD